MSLQKISSIHLFILEIQQIIESRDLKGHTLFDHAHPITIKVTFTFLKYVLACKHSARFMHSLKLEPHAHFWPQHPKIIKFIPNFPEFSPLWKISSLHPFIYPFTLWPQPFPNRSTPIFFYQLLVSGINMWKSRLFHIWFEIVYFFIYFIYFISTPFWPYMTEKQIYWLYLWLKEERWKKTKSRFHHHGQIITWC